MLKEISIICIILIIIFSAYFIAINHLSKTSDILVKKIEEVCSNIDNQERAKALMEDLSKSWDETNKTWSIIVQHEELDKIEIALLSAEIAIENQDKDYALIELGKLDFLLEHIKEKESFKLKNVF